MRRGPVIWRIVSRRCDRDFYTIERDRRLFRGRYRQVSGQELACQYGGARMPVSLERLWWLP